MKPLLFSIVMLISSQAFPAAWECRNHDIEITCDSKKCTSSDSFTPFSISIKESGELGICAYAGCWSGQNAQLVNGQHLLISAQNMKWSGTTPNKANFIVVLDKSDRVGMIKGEGFAMPFTCQK